MVGLIYHPYLFGVGSRPPSEAVSVFVWEQRLITNLYIDDFNLYYRALKDTLPRLGSTTGLTGLDSRFRLQDERPSGTLRTRTGIPLGPLVHPGWAPPAQIRCQRRLRS